MVSSMLRGLEVAATVDLLPRFGRLTVTAEGAVDGFPLGSVQHVSAYA
jgi:hypothetical protein